MERCGLFLGFVLGAIALATGGASLYWLKGPTLWVGAAAFSLLFLCAIMSVRAFERKLSISEPMRPHLLRPTSLLHRKSFDA